MFKRFVQIVGYPIVRLFYKIEVIGKENFLQDEPFVLVANHQSLLDVVVLYLSFNRPLNFMSKAELFKFKPLGAILKALGAIPVNRGENDFVAVKNSMKVLKNGEVLGIFPEGTRNDPVDADGAKAGAVMIAAKSKVPVVAATIKTNYKFRSKVCIILDEPYYFDKDKKYTNDDYKVITKTIVNRIKYLAEN